MINGYSSLIADMNDSCVSTLKASSVKPNKLKQFYAKHNKSKEIYQYNLQVIRQAELTDYRVFQQWEINFEKVLRSILFFDSLEDILPDGREKLLDRQGNRSDKTEETFN